MRKVSKIALLSLVTFMGVAHAEDPGQDIQLTREKPTAPATLVTLQPDKTMVASHVKVGAIGDGLPLLCFRDPEKQLVSCFEVNVKTGQVVWIQLPVDETVI